MSQPSMIGAYGAWAAEIVGEKPARLSLRRDEFRDLGAWRDQARERVRECLAIPEIGEPPKAEIQHTFEHDGLVIDHLSWQLPYGPPTEAYVLKPKDARGKLPAVIGLHDHGGNKYFGARKITRTSETIHPLMKEHQDQYYGGVAWGNELARRGYVVLVHDAFAFGSRRLRIADIPDVVNRTRLREKQPEDSKEIRAYNLFAAEHESLMAKSLFCAGTTWPGVFLGEDIQALNYLCTRDDVDASRIGCAGLSGGGLRTTYLAGMDDRIRCACCLGMMTTWRDYLLNKAHTHTWMIYIPLIARDLDYPEILGLRVPQPTLVLNCIEDQLFTVPEMRRADEILKAVYMKAGEPEKYQCTFHPGGHRFDRAMQAEAFTWLDRWLKA